MGLQPLETYKVGNYRLPIPCDLCRENNLYEAITCSNCGAPMDISRIEGGKKDNRRTRPQLIVPVGASNTGKSVYLGMALDILSRQGDRSDITTYGAASVTVQQQVIGALGRGHFPEPTDRNPFLWSWAHCKLSRHTAPDHLQVFLPDMSGWNVLRDADDESCPSIRGILQKATGIMLFIDTGRVQDGDKDEEFLALKILRYIESLVEQRADSRPARRRRTAPPDPQVPPVAVIMAKADECSECFDAPTDYVRGQMPNLWQALQDVAPLHACFAVSVAGAVAEVPLCKGGSTKLPLRVEPRGVLEPFRWLLGQAIG